MGKLYKQVGVEKEICKEAVELDILNKRLHKHGPGIKLLIAESPIPPVLELQKNTINSHCISLQSQIHKNEHTVNNWKL